MRIFVSILLVLFGAVSVLSQELTFSEPIKLGSNVNSEAEELNPLISADGKTLYFSRAFYDGNTGGKYAGTDIWVSKKDEQGQWMPSVKMGYGWNNKLSNSVIGINQDHSIVYLLNAYSNRSGISFSKLYNGEWSAPEFIPIPGINRNDFVGFYANPKFDVILISMKGKDSFGEEDLYVSLKDSFGNWTEPKNLGATINTKGFEISPFLTEDKKRLFFSSNGHGGFGDADIFYCDRLFDSWETWSVPKNLGDKINSKSFEAYFSMYDSVGFFSSSRMRDQSEIFVVTKKKIEKFVKVETVRQYLSNKEVTDLVGFDPLLRFDDGKSSLMDNHRQILKRIGIAIISKPEIKCYLVALKSTERSDLEIYQTRLLAILDYLKTIGIEGSRISLGLEEEAFNDKECVRFRLFK
jgi:hypothetical protein